MFAAKARVLRLLSYYGSRMGEDVLSGQLCLVILARVPLHGSDELLIGVGANDLAARRAGDFCWHDDRFPFGVGGGDPERTPQFIQMTFA